MTYTLHNTDVLEGMKLLEDKSVDCIITSPPYYQLRDYRWSGQWGLEKTYQEYIEHLWSFMDEAWRVLKDTGTVWINLGDTYSAKGDSTQATHSQFGKNDIDIAMKSFRSKDFPPKCLMLIPHRFAIGCIDRGWVLRNDIIWGKLNGMPESCRDRFSKKHEYIFFFTKSSKTQLWYHTKNKVWAYPLPEPDIIWINIETGNERKDEPIDNPVINQNITTKVPEEISEEISEEIASPRARQHREIRLWKKKNLWENRDYYFDLDSIRDKWTDTAIRRAYSNNNLEIRKDFNNEEFSIGGTSQKKFYEKVRKNINTNNPELDKPATHQFDTHNDKSAYNQLGKNPGDVADFWDNYRELPFKEFMDMMAEWYYSKDDFWDITTKPNSENHFATFNSELIDKPIIAGCPKGGTILDPFAGTGTTLLRALQLDRNVIGIEGKKEYHDIAEKKLKEFQDQLRLI